MSFSVNTNTGAMVALQYLNQTQGQIGQTQSAINSGMTVATRVTMARFSPSPRTNVPRLPVISR